MYAIRRLVPIGLLALATAVAQEPAAPEPPAVPPSVPVPAPGGPGGPARPGFPAPGARPGAPAAAAPVNQDNIPLAERKKTEPIINPKLNGNELAGLYREYTGRRVVVSSQAAQAEFAFIQDASPKDPLTYGKIAELLKMAALIEGFVFVPSGEGVDKLLFAGAGTNNPKGAGIGVYNETDELPPGDEVITYVMTLRFLKPEQAVQVFQQIIGAANPYASTAAIANASAVIITENTSLIRKLIQLKEEIDKPSSDVATRFIKVQYADVTELAETLNELLSTQQQAQRSAGIQRTEGAVQIQAPGGAPAAPGAAGGNRGGSAGEDTPVQIVPDPRTNRIFAMGRPVDLVFIEGLVREFDTRTDEKNFLRRKLRFLSASDFLSVASDALTRAFSNNGQGGGGGGGGASGANFGGGGGGGNRTGAAGGAGAGGRTSGASSRTSASSSRTSASSGSSGSFGGGGGGSGSGGGGSGGGGTLSEPNVSTAPQSVLVGRTLLVADNITNSIIVQGPPASVEVIERLLEQVDVKADQVMISSVFGQLTLTDNLDYGISYLSTFSRPGKNGGIAGSSNVGGTSGNTIVNPSSLLRPTTGALSATDTALGLSPFPAAGGLALYGKIGSNFNVYLNALQSTGNFTVLSRPSIYTANNKMGMISSGQQIAVPTGTQNNTGVNGGGLQTNIEYKDVVLKLEVVPLINSENEITLQISLVSDEVGESQRVSADLTVPTIITREMTTTVTVPNNQTVVLGGLIVTRDRNNVSGIPVLSKIPLLGKLFSTTGKDKEKAELLIFIQPSIVRNDANLDAVQADMGRRYKLEPDLRNFADGPGGPLLPPDGITPESDKYAKTPPQQQPVYDQPAPSKAKKKPRLGRP